MKTVHYKTCLDDVMGNVIMTQIYYMYLHFFKDIVGMTFIFYLNILIKYWNGCGTFYKHIQGHLH